ncbi:class I SAM-dependent methyltransferase [Flavobacterium jejuense]|uniref:Class I SAM-dependent methyltransferase n=1 Tax=Flavobacterium jejuense TaxID=1544455 RepID=A0ABX0IN02_9FLAO|nr:class I SAM-dependent methyltransferase [Flavobacterium jejuense]NHN24601.1 class I SAM-dependent methyltransferase [Flavobacterium jejuense]
MDKYKETFDTWNKIAQIYQDKFMDLDLYNKSYDSFLELIPKKNACILDIGCGPGNITKYLLSKNANLKIKGIDISENMIKLAKKNNPLAQFEVIDSREIDSLHQIFDAILCGFCIPYMSQSDCLKLIIDCYNLLNNSGVLYLSFVEGDYEKSGFISGSNGNRAYFYYHNLEFLEKILKENLFEVSRLYFEKYKKTDGSEEKHTILIVQKKSTC